MRRSCSGEALAECGSRVLGVRCRFRIFVQLKAGCELRVLVLKRAACEREYRILLQICEVERELHVWCQQHCFQPLFANSELDVFVNDQQSAWIAGVVANPCKLSLQSLGRSLEARLASATVLAMSQDIDFVGLMRDIVASHLGSTGSCQTLKRG